MKTQNRIKIGEGALSWNGAERRSDRYGTIGMFNENSNDETITRNAFLDIILIKENEGKTGELMCIVKEIRRSTHIGDLFHGFFPTTPKIGAKITLGKGKLFYEKPGFVDTVGLKPSDDRKIFWLIPKQLYRVHEQTVELYFIPEN